MKRFKTAPASRVYHEETVRTMLRVECERVAKKAVNDYSAGLCLVLKDYLHFGTKRAQKFLQKVSELYDDVQADRLSTDDIKKTIYEELGVVIK